MDIMIYGIQRRHRFVSGPPHSTGFTLIESLVVIAIIAILAAMLMAALSRAKSKGQSINCISNLKQLQLSWFTYKDDFRELLPPNQLSGSPGSSSPPGSWVVGDAQTDLTSSNIQSGVLFYYSQSTAIYHCPSDRATLARAGTQLRTRSYTLNGYLGCSNPFPRWASRMKTTYSQVTQM